MVEAVVIVRVGKIVQCLTGSQDTALGGTVQEHTQINIPGKAVQLWIKF